MAMPEPIGLREIRYLPEEINIWMYAMVALGAAFVVFVAISAYLMWRGVRGRREDVERKGLCADEKLPENSSNTDLPSVT